MNRKARETVMKRSGLVNGQERWTVQNVNQKNSFNSRNISTVMPYRKPLMTIVVVFLNKITIHLKIDSKQKRIKIFYYILKILAPKKNISPS